MNLHSSPYNAYRPSKNEWVDQTPCEWEEKRVKDLFRLVTDKAADDNDHELLSLYASIGVRPRKDLEARGNKASSTDGYWLVKRGDIVVNKLLAWMGSVGLSEYDGVTSPAYDVLRKSSKLVDVRYFSYLFRTEIAKQIFKRNSRGIMDMRLRLYFDKLGAITVPVPPYSTQQAIATYIDTKTAQIDRQIDFLSQKTAKYGKLKQSLIAETVTRGMDKSVPMKDSEIDWIDEIPEGWKILHLKNCVSKKITDGPHATPVFLDDGVPFLSAEAVQEGGLNFASKRGYISKEDDKNYALKCKPKRNDIFLVKSGATTGKVGYVSTDEDFNIWSPLALIRSGKNFNPRYVFHFLSSVYFQQQVQRFWSFGTQPNIGMGVIEALQIVVPPLWEQTAIAFYLDEKTAQIDQIVTSINSQIGKLQNLRKALINDVVTGKIKVV